MVYDKLGDSTAAIEDYTAFLMRTHSANEDLAQIHASKRIKALGGELPE